MKFDAGRVKVNDHNQLKSCYEDIALGQSFAFLSKKFFKSPALTWVSTLFGKADSGEEKILPLVGRNPIQLPGFTLSTLQTPKLKIASITSDKEIYGAQADVVNLLIASPLYCNSNVRVLVMKDGLDFSEHMVEINQSGTGTLKLKDLPSGEFEVGFQNDQPEFYCRFTVAEYKLVPLVASLLSRRLLKKDKLSLKVNLTSYGEPVDGLVLVSVLENGIFQGRFEFTAKNGILDAEVNLEGAGPHALALQLKADPSKTASLPLSGTRASEREATLFSSLGVEVEGSLLPSDESSTDVHGVYLAEGGTTNAPFTLERVDTDTIRLKVNAEKITTLSAVLIDPYAPKPGDFAVDPDSAQHPSVADKGYKEAEELFKQGEYLEALSLFEKSRDALKNPHPYYAYFAACCLAKLDKPEAALSRLAVAIEDGWNSFDHMEEDDDLESIKQTREFKFLLSGGCIVETYDHPEQGSLIELKDAFKPLTVLSLGAYIDGKPWEGWACILSCEKLSIDLKVEGDAEPGEEVIISLKSSDKSVQKAYAIVKDARLLTADNPRSRLASRLKTTVKEAGETLNQGFVKESLKEICQTNNVNLFGAESTFLSAGGGWGATPGDVPPPMAAGGAWGQAPMDAVAFLDAGVSPMPAGMMSQLIRRRQSSETFVDQAKDLESRGEEEKPNDSVVDAQPEVLFADLVDLKEGEGAIAVNLPDRFLDYVVEVFAIHDLDWTAAKVSFTVSKDPFVDLVTPVFTREDEETYGTIYSASKSATDLAIRLLKDGSEVELLSGDNKKLSGKDIAITSDVAKFTFLASPGLYEAQLLDKDKNVLTSTKKLIQEPGKLKRQVRSLKLLEEGESLLLSEDESIVSLSVLPGLESSFDVLVEATSSYSHCCCEQTAAKILAGCAMYMLAGGGNGNGNGNGKRKDAESIIAAGVRREETMWLRGRGFKSYPESRSEPDQYYGKKASEYLWNLNLLESGDALGSDLEKQVKLALNMAKDTSRAYEISCPPERILSYHDAYMTIVFGNGNGDGDKALSYVRKKLASYGSYDNFTRNLPDNPWLGVKVFARLEASYAAAALLRSKKAEDKKAALDLANAVISQFNEDGRLYSTCDSVAAIALMSELNNSRVTGGSVVEIEGKKHSVNEAMSLTEAIKGVKVLEGVAAVECSKEIIEDWDKYSSGISMKVALLKDDSAGRKFSLGDNLILEVTLTDGYKDGDILWVCLPEALSRIIGGGQVKLFSVDFKGESKLSIPLAATGITGNGGSDPQKFAVCARNMFDEDRAGSPGLIDVFVKKA